MPPSKPVPLPSEMPPSKPLSLPSESSQRCLPCQTCERGDQARSRSRAERSRAVAMWLFDQVRSGAALFLLTVGILRLSLLQVCERKASEHVASSGMRSGWR